MAMGMVSVPDAPPPDDGPGDSEARPSSIFAGIGDCVVDELVGLWELAKFLYELKEDFDIASDGVDNYFSSLAYDAYQTMSLLSDLEDGEAQFSALPNEQQLALQRLYAKQALIRAELEKAMDHGINVLAALDIYVMDTEREHFIPIVPRYALKTIIAGMGMLYEHDEWLRRAEVGRDFVEEMIAAIQAEIEARPWYVAGYVMCIIATMIIPISKVTAAIRSLRPVLAILDAAPNGAAIRRALRGNGLDMPEHLGGSRRPEADTTPHADTPPDAESSPIEPIVTDADRPRSDVETQSNPERVEDPERLDTPDPDANTTIIPATRRIGDIAEADARARLEADGFETFELKNGSGHGPDIIAVHPETGQIRIVEVKANSSSLNPLQQQGGAAYMQSVFGRIDGRSGGGSWNTREFDEFLENVGLESRDDLLSADFEIWRYHGVDPDNPASVRGGPQTTTWTPGTTGREFRLDANGNIESRRGPNREWTPYVEPDEYVN